MTSKSIVTQKKQLKPLKKEHWKPKLAQKKGLKALLENSCHALFLDPGLGKTSVTLAAVKILKQEQLIDKVLIVAPLRVCYLVWPKEIAKWEEFSDLTYAILHGKDKERNLKKEADIYIINPEGLFWLAKQNFKRLGFDMLVVDESTKFKSCSSKRFKLLKMLLGFFRRRYILTGTPTPNGMMDLFSQIMIVDGGAALGRYITHYRNQYFYPSGYGGYEWKLQEDAEKRIQQKIKPITLRLEAEDFLDLPEIVINRIDVELPEEVRDIYKEMEDDMFSSLDRGDIVAVNAAAASIKCRQIANGGVYDEHRNVHHLHMAKAEAVGDLVEELQGTPALVAYEFHHDLERLLKVLGKNTPYIGAGVSEKRTAEIEAAWNRGEIPVLLGNPASMGHGLNLQNAGNHIIWHSLTWNFENYDQFNKRVRRQGSKHARVFIHHLMVRDTIDEAIMFAIKHKDRTQKSLLNGLKAYKKKKIQE